MELPLTPNREQDLEQQRTEELFRRNRQASDFGLQSVEGRTDLRHHLIHQGAHAAQGMTVWDPFVHRPIDEQGLLGSP